MKPLALAPITLLAVLLTSVGHGAVKNVVLVHGAFADGSGWKPVADVLRHDGFTVYVVQEPGYLQVKPESFPEDFAADVPKRLARFMAISQVPISVEAFGAKATAAAWSKRSSYAVVAQQDRMINPDLERFMTRRAKSETTELPGSHAIFLSHPKEVAALIEKAAKAAE
jgi:pimeloyl-ACP methyl ester carboxylesterase